MGRKPKRRARRKGVRQARSKGKRPSSLDIPVATDSARAKPIMVMETIRSQLAALAPLKRKRTILLMEGTNALTGRPVRIYISPTDKLTCVETITEGRLERT